MIGDDFHSHFSPTAIAIKSCGTVSDSVLGAQFERDGLSDPVEFGCLSWIERPSPADAN